MQSEHCRKPVEVFKQLIVEKDDTWSLLIVALGPKRKRPNFGVRDHTKALTQAVYVGRLIL